MAIIAHVLSTSETSRPNVAKAIRRKTGPLKYWLAASSAAIVIASAGSATADDITLAKAPPVGVPSAYDWSGFYAGGHVGQAWGTSNWTSTPAPTAKPSRQRNGCSTAPVASCVSVCRS
jgi:hypothetical protein